MLTDSSRTSSLDIAKSEGSGAAETFEATELSEEPLMVRLLNKSALLRLTSVPDAIPQIV